MYFYIFVSFYVNMDVKSAIKFEEEYILTNDQERFELSLVHTRF